jgi:hypothetical protein
MNRISALFHRNDEEQLALEAYQLVNRREKFDSNWLITDNGVERRLGAVLLRIFYCPDCHGYHYMAHGPDRTWGSGESFPSTEMALGELFLVIDATLSPEEFDELLSQGDAA